MSEITWQDSLSAALEEARTTEKPVLLYFWTPD